MVLSRLLKPGFNSALIILFITLQISACNLVEPTNTNGNNQLTGTFDNSSVSGISFSWTAPSQREDSSAIALSEIAGYRIYFGNTPGSYRRSIDVNDSSADSYTLNNLPAGTYYFSLTTYDTEGRESRYSPPVRIVI